MKRLMLVLLILIQAPAFAENTSSIRHWSLGAGASSLFEPSVSDEDYEQRTAKSFFVGYRWDQVEALLEASFYETAASTGFLSTRLKHQELMPWLRYRFLNDRNWTPFVGASLGLVKEEVITRLEQQQIQSEGDLQWQSGFAIGVSADLWQRLRAELDAKMLQPESEPSMSWLMSARLGYSF